MNNGILAYNKSYSSSGSFGLLGNPSPVPMPHDLWHPDAQNWRGRVISNGGSVTNSTMEAVSRFCRKIDAAGMRDKFFRLNLFCGDNLNACLVPLYTGPSLLDNKYGNSADINVGFTSSDYNSRGDNRGLKSNRSKYLKTGLLPNMINGASNSLSAGLHIGCYASYQNPSHAFSFLIGAATVANTNEFVLAQWVNNGQYLFYPMANSANVTSTVWPPPFFMMGIIKRSSIVNNSDIILITDNTKNTSTVSASSIFNNVEFYIFNVNRAGSPAAGFGSDGRLTYYSIGRDLNDTEVSILRSSIIDFNTELSLSIPIVSNADAQSWINRVYTSGGQVSLTTASAVNTFCNAIDSAGIRNKFVRLNLFCGSNLSACLVPLYRGQSLSGTQFGNATDTNNSFVAADYNEASGLISNGSSKWLDTGLPLNFATGRHIGVVLASLGLAGRYFIGAWGAFGNNSIFGIYTQANQNLTAFNFSDAGESGSAGNSAPTLRRSAIASSNPGAGGLALFLNGTSVGTGTAFSTAITGPISIFGLRRNGASTPELITNARLSGYTIGTNLSAAEASAINDALATFNTTMGRV